MLKTLTDAEIQNFAKDWYRQLDVHAPMVDVLPMLSTRGLRMKFPEATLHGLADFESWYQGVIRIFFDEKHKVTKVTSKIKGTKATAKIVVRWEASRWRAPGANSDRIVLDAYQTWEIQRSLVTEKPEIVTYSVDSLVYVKGSAKL